MMKHKRIVMIALPLVLLLVGYNNCSSTHDMGGLVMLSKGGNCDQNLLAEYQMDVYPFFRADNHCVHCHIEGGIGLGTFASADVNKSFTAFSAAGLSTVSFMATNPQHHPPYTGTQNQPEVDAFNKAWLADQKEFLACVSASQNGGVDESLLTAPKTAPNIYSAPGVVQTLTWDLNLGSDLDASVTRSVPARVSVDVQVLNQGTGTDTHTTGYIFSNPTMQLTDSTKQVIVEGLFFQINGQPISSQTTFTSLSRIISGPTQLPLMIAQANTLINPVASTDTFQLYFRRLDLTAGASQSDPPMTPILRVVDANSGSDKLISDTTANVIVMRDAGVTRWCLSESSVKPASTEAPCQNSGTGTDFVNGWQLKRPTSYTFQSGDGVKHLYLWIADQNLNINLTPAAYDVTLDTVAPAAATIADITLGNTQVASMTVTHPNEADVTGWCVIEQNSIKPVPGKPNLDDDCWKWTDNGAKPTTVGFKAGGSRDVWVYVRDLAGNVSAASNKVTRVNSFGAITFTQLTSTSGGPMAIFNNRCLTCHGAAGNPGYTALHLFDYSAAIGVATSGVLVSRINNPISPMPNVAGGLMSQADRDLIRLWVMPEEGSTPLP